MFISNPGKSVLLCKQKAGKGARKFVVWDYHVIALFKDENNDFYVWDFDSTMESPIRASEYLQQTFPSDIVLRKEFIPKFRIIQGQNFLDYFSSIEAICSNLQIRKSIQCLRLYILVFKDLAQNLQ